MHVCVHACALRCGQRDIGFLFPKIPMKLLIIVDCSSLQLDDKDQNIKLSLLTSSYDVYNVRSEARLEQLFSQITFSV